MDTLSRKLMLPHALFSLYPSRPYQRQVHVNAERSRQAVGATEGLASRFPSEPTPSQHAPGWAFNFDPPQRVEGGGDKVRLRVTLDVPEEHVPVVYGLVGAFCVGIVAMSLTTMLAIRRGR